MSKIILKKVSWTVQEVMNKLETINLRPQYQREFIYNAIEQAKVIDSIILGLPLNSIYLNELPDGSAYNYEVIDGQQRLTSIDNFVNQSLTLTEMNDTNLNNKVWQGIPIETQTQILDYILDIYIVTKENTSNTKYDMFKRINTVGTQLNQMELLNATHSGVFVNNLKKFCHDNDINLRQVTGKSWLRAETEEIIVSWFAQSNNKNDLSSFLGLNQFNESLDYLKLVVRVLNWVLKITDKKYRPKLYNFYDLYNLYKKYFETEFNPEELKELCELLYSNLEIQNKRGILQYSLEYLVHGIENDQLLNLRHFPPEFKPMMLQTQNYLCAICGKDLSDEKEYRIAELDHIVSWKDGGLTEKANCQLLCQMCNREKGAK